MDASTKKAFQVKVRCLVRTLKEYKAYKNEVDSYDLNVVSQDKKKQEFYLESKSALEQVEKKLVEYYHTLNAYMVPLGLFRMNIRPRSKKKHHSMMTAFWQTPILMKLSLSSLGPADLTHLFLIIFTVIKIDSNISFLLSFRRDIELNGFKMVIILWMLKA